MDFSKLYEDDNKIPPTYVVDGALHEDDPAFQDAVNKINSAKTAKSTDFSALYDEKDDGYISTAAKSIWQGLGQNTEAALTFAGINFNSPYLLKQARQVKDYSGKMEPIYSGDQAPEPWDDPLGWATHKQGLTKAAPRSIAASAGPLAVGLTATALSGGSAIPGVFGAYVSAEIAGAPIENIVNNYGIDNYDAMKARGLSDEDIKTDLAIKTTTDSLYQMAVEKGLAKIAGAIRPSMIDKSFVKRLGLNLTQEELSEVLTEVKQGYTEAELQGREMGEKDVKNLIAETLMTTLVQGGIPSTIGASQTTRQYNQRIDGLSKLGIDQKVANSIYDSGQNDIDYFNGKTYDLKGGVNIKDTNDNAKQSLIMLSNWYKNRTGNNLFVTSARDGDMHVEGESGTHNSGDKYDLATDELENNAELRKEFIDYANSLGLEVLDEYTNPSANSTGGHLDINTIGFNPQGLVSQDVNIEDDLPDYDIMLKNLNSENYILDANDLRGLTYEQIRSLRKDSDGFSDDNVITLDKELNGINKVINNVKKDKARGFAKMSRGIDEVKDGGKNLISNYRLAKWAENPTLANAPHHAANYQAVLNALKKRGFDIEQKEDGSYRAFRTAKVNWGIDPDYDRAKGEEYIIAKKPEISPDGTRIKRTEEEDFLNPHDRVINQSRPNFTRADRQVVPYSGAEGRQEVPKEKTKTDPNAPTLAPDTQTGPISETLVTEIRNQWKGKTTKEKAIDLISRINKSNNKNINTLLDYINSPEIEAQFTKMPGVINDIREIASDKSNELNATIDVAAKKKAPPIRQLKAAPSKAVTPRFTKENIKPSIASWVKDIPNMPLDRVQNRLAAIERGSKAYSQETIDALRKREKELRPKSVSKAHFNIEKIEDLKELRELREDTKSPALLARINRQIEKTKKAAAERKATAAEKKQKSNYGTEEIKNIDKTTKAAIVRQLKQLDKYTKESQEAILKRAEHLGLTREDINQEKAEVKKEDVLKELSFIQFQKLMNIPGNRLNTWAERHIGPNAKLTLEDVNNEALRRYPAIANDLQQDRERQVKIFLEENGDILEGKTQKEQNKIISQFKKSIEGRPINQKLLDEVQAGNYYIKSEDIAGGIVGEEREALIPVVEKPPERKRFIPPGAKASLNVGDTRLRLTKQNFAWEVLKYFPKGSSLRFINDRLISIEYDGVYHFFELTDYIPVEEQQLRAHGIPKSDWDQYFNEGAYDPNSKLILLNSKQTLNAIPHELFHEARDRFLNIDEKRYLDKVLPNEEDQAKDYANFVNTRRSKYGLEKIWQKIYDGIQSIINALGYTTKHGIYMHIQDFSVSTRGDVNLVGDANTAWASLMKRIPKEISQAIKDYFSGTSASTSKGVPLVMYRTDSVPNIEVYDRNKSHQMGFHIALTNKVSKTGKFYGDTNQTREVYIRSNNPLHLPDVGSWDIQGINMFYLPSVENNRTQEGRKNVTDFKKHIENAGINYNHFVKMVRSIKSNGKLDINQKNSAFMDYLKSLGFDSITYFNTYEGGIPKGQYNKLSKYDKQFFMPSNGIEWEDGIDDKTKPDYLEKSWMVFDSNQIKSIENLAPTNAENIFTSVVSINAPGLTASEREDIRKHGNTSYDGVMSKYFDDKIADNFKQSHADILYKSKGVMNIKPFLSPELQRIYDKAGINKIGIKFEESFVGKDIGGAYIPDLRRILLNPEFKDDLYQLHLVLKHELQHAIQVMEARNNGFHYDRVTYDHMAEFKNELDKIKSPIPLFIREAFNDIEIPKSPTKMWFNKNEKRKKIIYTLNVGELEARDASYDLEKNDKKAREDMDQWDKKLREIATNFPQLTNTLSLPKKNSIGSLQMKNGDDGSSKAKTWKKSLNITKPAEKSLSSKELGKNEWVHSGWGKFTGDRIEYRPRTGEGHMIHGAGVYIQKDVKHNKRNYFDRHNNMTGDAFLGHLIVNYKGKPIKREDVWDSNAGKFKNRYMQENFLKLFLRTEIKYAKPEDVIKNPKSVLIQRKNDIINSFKDAIPKIDQAIEITSDDNYNYDDVMKKLLENPKFELVKGDEMVFDGDHVVLSDGDVYVDSAQFYYDNDKPQPEDYEIQGDLKLLKKDMLNTINMLENIDINNLDITIERAQSDIGYQFIVQAPPQSLLLNAKIPFSEQPSNIKSKLKRLLKDLKKTLHPTKYEWIDRAINDNNNGEEIYNWLGSAVYDANNNDKNVKSKQDQAASDILNKYNILGLKYSGNVDGLSVVIFNPNNLRIVGQTQGPKIDTLEQFYAKNTEKDESLRVLDINDPKTWDTGYDPIRFAGRSKKTGEYKYSIAKKEPKISSSTQKILGSNKDISQFTIKPSNIERVSNKRFISDLEALGWKKTIGKDGTVKLSSPDKNTNTSVDKSGSIVSGVFKDTKKSEILNNIYAHVFDDMATLYGAMRRAGANDTQVQKLQDKVQLALNGSRIRAEERLDNGGTYSYKGKSGKQITVNAKGITYLDKIFDKDKKLGALFDEYIDARRIPDLVALKAKGRDIVLHMTPQEANSTIARIEAQHPEFRNYQTDIVNMNNLSLSRLRDSGKITDDAFNYWVNNHPNYVPYKIKELVSEPDTFMSNLNSKNLKSIGDPVKKLKGSERDIESPFAQTIRKAILFENVASRNEVQNTIRELVESDKETFKSVMEEVDVDRASGNKNAVKITVNGENKYYIASPTLASALTNLDQNSANVLKEFMRMSARALRIGSTSNPVFAIGNVSRDSLTGWFATNVGYIPIVDNIKGAYHFLANTDVYKEYRKHGGSVGGETYAALKSNPWDMNTDFIHRNIDKFMDVVFFNRFSPLKVLTTFTEAMEISTRLAIFELSAKGYQGYLDRLNNMDSIMSKNGNILDTAALLSRRATIDFSRGGTTAKDLNRYTPFLNAYAQGFDLVANRFLNHTADAAIKTSLLTMASLCFLAGWGDDPELEEEPQYNKDTHWLFRTSNGSIGRIPVPQEIGSVVNILTRALYEDIVKDKDINKIELLNSLRKTFAPNMLPPILSAIFGYQANYDYFLDRNIEGKFDENIPAYQRFSRGTSEGAKMIGASAIMRWFSADGMSPKKIDFIARSLGGRLPTSLLQSETLFGEKRIATPEIEKAYGTINVLSRFFSTPLRAPQSVHDVWVEKTELDKQKRMFDSGDIAEFDRRKYKIITDTANKLSKISKAIKALDRDKSNRTNDELRLEFERLTRIQTNLARNALAQVRKLK